MASRGVLIVAQHPREPFRLPTFLPTPSTYPFPSSHLRPTHFPPDHHSLLTSSYFTSPIPPSPTRPRHPTPCTLLLQQTTPCPVARKPPGETPSDIHRRVSSELIIKCIVVPARGGPSPCNTSPLPPPTPFPAVARRRCSFANPPRPSLSLSLPRSSADSRTVPSSFAGRV